MVQQQDDRFGLAATAASYVRADYVL
jgi:hypothetical protein